VLRRCVWSRNLEHEEAKVRYRAVKIQPQWVVTPGKQTNKLAHCEVWNEFLNTISIHFLLQNLRPVTVEASPCRICGGQSGTGADFSSSTSGFLPWQSHFIYLTILSRIGESVMCSCLLSALLVSNLARCAFPIPGDEGNPPRTTSSHAFCVMTIYVLVDHVCRWHFSSLEKGAVKFAKGKLMFSSPKHVTTSWARPVSYTMGDGVVLRE